MRATDPRLIEQARLLRLADEIMEAKGPKFVPLKAWPAATHPRQADIDRYRAIGSRERLA